MKSAPTAILMAITAISISFSSYAQNVKPRKKVYGKMNLMNGLFIPQGSGVKNLSVSFPYSIPDANGKPVTSSFNGTIQKPFSSVLDFIGLSFEMGTRNHFFSFETGASPIFSPRGMYQVMAGYGHYWTITKNGIKNDMDAKGLFMLSASMSFAVVNRKQLLGAIDNEDQTVTAFGKNIAPYYNASSNDNQGDFYAKEIAVYYRQTACGLMPQISIFTNTRTSIELSLSYFLPFSESPVINLYKHDDDAILDFAYSFAAKSKLAEKDMEVKADNTIATKAPFGLGNFQVKLKVGLWGQ